MTYYHTYSKEALELRPQEQRVLDALHTLPDIQTKVQIMLIEQNRPDWAFGFLLGCHLASQVVDPAHQHTRALTTAFEHTVDRGIIESTARPEYVKYTKIRKVA